MAEGKLVAPHNFPHMQKLLGERSLLWMTGRKHQQNRRILAQVLVPPPLLSAGLMALLSYSNATSCHGS